MDLIKIISKQKIITKMRKRIFNYVPVLPHELRPLCSMNSLSQIPQSMLTKLAEGEMREEKARKFPRKKVIKNNF